MEKKTFFTVRNLALIGVLAAIVFVLTKFISIPIPSPLGKTALSVGNAMCVLSALLFGPAVGGLAAGIGNALVDLTDPAWAPEFWITFINKFLMAFIAGVIMHKVHVGSERVRVWVASLCGALTYCVLYVAKNILEGRAGQRLHLGGGHYGDPDGEAAGDPGQRSHRRGVRGAAVPGPAPAPAEGPRPVRLTETCFPLPRRRHCAVGAGACRKRLTPFPPKGIRYALRLGTAFSGPCDARFAQSVFPTYTPPEKRFHFLPPPAGGVPTRGRSHPYGSIAADGCARTLRGFFDRLDKEGIFPCPSRHPRTKE